MNFWDCWAKQEKKTTVYEINGLKKQYEVNLSFYLISTKSICKLVKVIAPRQYQILQRTDFNFKLIYTSAKLIYTF